MIMNGQMLLKADKGGGGSWVKQMLTAWTLPMRWLTRRKTARMTNDQRNFTKFIDQKVGGNVAKITHGESADQRCNND